MQKMKVETLHQKWSDQFQCDTTEPHKCKSQVIEVAEVIMQIAMLLNQPAVAVVSES